MIPPVSRSGSRRTGGPEPPSVEVMIANIERTVDIAGVDHIAIGTDSECYPGSYPPQLSRSLAAESPEVYGPFRKAFPKGSRTQGFENMESLPHLTHLLLERAWKECDIKKLLGENFMRVYKAAWGA